MVLAKVAVIDPLNAQTATKLIVLAVRQDIIQNYLTVSLATPLFPNVNLAKAQISAQVVKINNMD